MPRSRAVKGIALNVRRRFRLSSSTVTSVRRRSFSNPSSVQLRCCVPAAMVSVTVSAAHAGPARNAIAQPSAPTAIAIQAFMGLSPKRAKNVRQSLAIILAVAGVRQLADESPHYGSPARTPGIAETDSGPLPDG